MGEGTEFDSWFDKDELETCPNCGERRLVPGEPQQGLRVCLDCGIVEVREEEGSDVAAHGEPCEPSPE
jgi:DNA-directed RNA polymerase subunit RPC12/RpoP